MPKINLGKRIKKSRSNLNISQDRLAKKANIFFSTLVKIEAGIHQIPLRKHL